MVVDVTVWGVVVATLAAMLIGTIWYSPLLFGKQWSKMIGLKDKDMQSMRNSSMMGITVVSILTAYVLNFFIVYVHNSIGGGLLSAGFKTGLLVWLGFGVTTIFAHGLFEPRDKKILLINAGNRLVTLVAMGLILGAFIK